LLPDTYQEIDRPENHEILTARTLWLHFVRRGTGCSAASPAASSSGPGEILRRCCHRDPRMKVTI